MSDDDVDDGINQVEHDYAGINPVDIDYARKGSILVLSTFGETGATKEEFDRKFRWLKNKLRE